MKQSTSDQIRQMWIDFWSEKHHDIIPSASLVPHDDPTLLWINSGVAALKHYLDGSEVPDNPKIANVQKCIRTNDIENVGYTARHQTLFEMLGNWSIGDYFKKEMIPWAWEFLTDEKWLGFDPELLYMTYYPEDDETVSLWREVTGLSEDHFIPMKENVWDLGAGPCGPDTEIFFDRGEKYQDLPDEDPEMFPGGENERYLEIWNIVFSQYNHLPDDTYVDLKHKNIDTGMGLERVTSVIQDTPTNFETDLFRPIIDKIEDLATNVRYGDSDPTDVSFKVIADHTRAVTFAIGDSALPSNEGRGYVLRRLIRRAVMHGRHLGIHESFLYQLVPAIVEKMGEFYHEIQENQALIQKVIKQEEERFQATISDGEKLLNELIQQLREEKSTVLNGEDAFKLFDTYGFPLELTQEYLQEEAMSVDTEGFAAAMQVQRDRARQARKKIGGLAVQSTLLNEIDVESEFVGYDEDCIVSKVNTLIWNNNFVDEVPADEVAYFVVEKTPFYAERGGQVTDVGEIYTPAGELIGRVIDVQHAPNEQNVHEVELVMPLKINQEIKLTVNVARRNLIRKNHTATHLVHRALKDVLGESVNQAGSLLDEHYLRFDFNYFGSVSEVDLQKVEDIVNEKIYEQIPVVTTLTTVDEAKEHGAMALFDDRYGRLGELVRLVNIADWSIELCGGTHVRNTADIGLFKIISEVGIGSGIRRIEALTSKGAVDYYKEQTEILDTTKRLLKVKQQDEIEKRITQLESERKALAKELEAIQDKMNHAAAEDIFKNVQVVGDIRYIAQAPANREMKDLRHIADEWKQGDYSDVLVLATSKGQKANLLVAVQPQMINKGIKAGDLIRSLAPKIDGGGGGRPDLAQAGGKNPNGIPEVLKEIENLLRQY